MLWSLVPTQAYKDMLRGCLVGTVSWFLHGAMVLLWRLDTRSRSFPFACVLFVRILIGDQKRCRSASAYTCSCLDM